MNEDIILRLNLLIKEEPSFIPLLRSLIRDMIIIQPKNNQLKQLLLALIEERGEDGKTRD